MKNVVIKVLKTIMTRPNNEEQPTRVAGPNDDRLNRGAEDIVRDFYNNNIFYNNNNIIPRVPLLGRGVRIDFRINQQNAYNQQNINNQQ
jgi:hypothetical protein